MPSWPCPWPGCYPLINPQPAALTDFPSTAHLGRPFLSAIPWSVANLSLARANTGRKLGRSLPPPRVCNPVCHVMSVLRIYCTAQKYKFQQQNYYYSSFPPTRYVEKYISPSKRGLDTHFPFPCEFSQLQDSYRNLCTWPRPILSPRLIVSHFMEAKRG